MIFTLALFVGCKKKGEKEEEECVEETSTSIQLQWNKAYSNDDLQLSIKGLEWALSHIGAINTEKVQDMVLDQNHILLDVEILGFSTTAQENLIKLNNALKGSGEYTKNGSIDLGRYVTLLIGAPEHYYDFVGMPKKYTDLLAQYTLGNEEGYVNNSSLTPHIRIIKFSQQNGLNQLFVSEEHDKDTDELLEYETIDIMDNGQLRFGIFDANGNRKNSTDPLKTDAGKPGKCMWCHESKIQPLFKDQMDFTGYLTYQAFKDTLTYYRTKHFNQQLNFTTGIDYSNSTDHILMELLYISFMEPSAERLSLEWGIPVEEVENTLSHLTTHTHHEFGNILGETYTREEVASFAPYTSLAVSSDVREKSAFEADHF